MTSQCVQQRVERIGSLRYTLKGAVQNYVFLEATNNYFYAYSSVHVG